MAKTKKKQENITELEPEAIQTETPKKKGRRGGFGPRRYAKKAAPEDGSQEVKKKSKYKNNKIFEYEDGSFTANDREDISPTQEEKDAALKEEADAEIVLQVAKEEYLAVSRLARRNVDKKIIETKEQLEKLKDKGRKTEAKEAKLAELEQLAKDIVDAQSKLSDVTEAQDAAQARYDWLHKRNELMMEGKRLEIAIFDSKKEFKRWNELKQLQSEGKISELKRQVSYELQPKFINAEGESIHAIKYMADFEYVENNKIIVEDVKAIIKKTGKPMTTPDFKIKWKMLQYKYPHIAFRIY